MSRTPLLQVNPMFPDETTVRRAAEVIRSGGLVAFPTETVYGLGADATSQAAIAKIFKAKGRPVSDPLIVHVAQAGELERIADSVPDSVEPLARAFWPGPLTLVVPRADAIPPAVSAGRDTVAVRVPSHPVALALIREAGVPIAAPSANLFSRPSPTRAEHVLEDLDGRLDLILDGGPSAVGVESTVLDLTSRPPAILRPGGVPLEELSAVVGEVEYRPREADPQEAQAAPGMLLKHYSPRARVILCEHGADGLRARAGRHLARGEKVGALLADEDRAALDGLPVETGSLGPEGSPQEAAQRLFAELRRLDGLGVDVILSRQPARQGLGLAVWDRLFRAAEGQVE